MYLFIYVCFPFSQNKNTLVYSFFHLLFSYLVLFASFPCNNHISFLMLDISASLLLLVSLHN